MTRPGELGKPVWQAGSEGMGTWTAHGAQQAVLHPAGVSCCLAHEQGCSSLEALVLPWRIWRQLAVCQLCSHTRLQVGQAVCLAGAPGSAEGRAAEAGGSLAAAAGGLSGPPRGAPAPQHAGQGHLCPRALGPGLHGARLQHLRQQHAGVWRSRHAQGEDACICMQGGMPRGRADCSCTLTNRPPATHESGSRQSLTPCWRLQSSACALTNCVPIKPARAKVSSCPINLESSRALSFAEPCCAHVILQEQEHDVHMHHALISACHQPRPHSAKSHRSAKSGCTSRSHRKLPMHYQPLAQPWAAGEDTPGQPSTSQRQAGGRRSHEGLQLSQEGHAATAVAFSDQQLGAAVDPLQIIKSLEIARWVAAAAAATTAASSNAVLDDEDAGSQDSTERPRGGQIPGWRGSSKATGGAAQELDASVADLIR